MSQITPQVMFLRKVPMQRSFEIDGKIYVRVGTDQAKDKDGNVSKMSKNTKVTLLDKEEMTDADFLEVSEETLVSLSEILPERAVPDVIRTDD